MALDIKPRTKTRVVQRQSTARPEEIKVDICVVGAGSAGISASIEAAKLGRSVALVDSQPALGGQAVNSVIGAFCGLSSNGPIRIK
jgi:heterodisulfide reductase subunit A-like polyferredoxin